VEATKPAAPPHKDNRKRDFYRKPKPQPKHKTKEEETNHSKTKEEENKHKSKPEETKHKSKPEDTKHKSKPEDTKHKSEDKTKPKPKPNKSKEEKTKPKHSKAMEEAAKPTGAKIAQPIIAPAPVVVVPVAPPAHAAPIPPHPVKVNKRDLIPDLICTVNGIVNILTDVLSLPTDLMGSYLTLAPSISSVGGVTSGLVAQLTSGVSGLQSSFTTHCGVSLEDCTNSTASIITAADADDCVQQCLQEAVQASVQKNEPLICLGVTIDRSATANNCLYLVGVNGTDNLLQCVQNKGEDTPSSSGGIAGITGALGGITGGGSPISGLTGALGGVTGGGNPLGGVTAALGGLTGGGNPLNGLLSGLTGGGGGLGGLSSLTAILTGILKGSAANGGAGLGGILGGASSGGQLGGVNTIIVTLLQTTQQIIPL
jgi:hypothetical protein